MRKAIFYLTLILSLLDINRSGFCLPSIKVKDGPGKVIELDRAPQSIASLAASIAEVLCTIDLEKQIIGITDYCNYPKRAKQKEKIGGFATPNIDKIVSLEPDIIFAFGTPRQPVVEKLVTRGQKVFWIYPLIQRKVNTVLTTIKNNKILVIPCSLLSYRPWSHIAETIERTDRFLHPEKFTTSQSAPVVQVSFPSRNSNLFTTSCHSDSNDYPQRIVSLGPAITEELYLLGVEDKLIANTIYCQRPPEARKKLKIGTVITVDIERILNLKPDLVLATSLTDPKQVEKLRKLGLKVWRFPQAKNFSQICDNFLQLSKMVGKEKRAHNILAKVKQQIQKVKTRFGNLPKPRVFIQVGANPLFTVTKDSFINELIELAGGVNIARGVKSGFYSREQVIKQNPDIILIVTMGIVGEQEKKIWQKFKNINAIRNNRIYIIDSNKVCSPTPLSFVEALQELTRIFHPGINDE